MCQKKPSNLGRLNIVVSNSSAESIPLLVLCADAKNDYGNDCVKHD